MRSLLCSGKNFGKGSENDRNGFYGSLNHRRDEVWDLHGRVFPFVFVPAERVAAASFINIVSWFLLRQAQEALRVLPLLLIGDEILFQRTRNLIHKQLLFGKILVDFT